MASEQPVDEVREGNMVGPWPYPPNPVMVAEEEDIDLFDLLRVLWRWKWFIALLTILAGAGATLVALLSTPVYRAQVLLAPVVEEGAFDVSARIAQFSGLANLVGFNSAASGDTEQAIAVLQSRAFTEQFIRDNELLPILFAKHWDAAKKEWLVRESSLEERVVAMIKEALSRVVESEILASRASGDPTPTMWAAYREFNDIRIVDIDRSGLVTLAVEWRDPVQAANWANKLVKNVNARLRRRVIAETEKNIAYLRGQLERTTTVELRQLLYRLMANETKTIMLANGRDEFAFRVIDPAVVPEERSRPRVRIIALVSLIVGFGITVILSFFFDSVKKHRARLRAKA